MSLMTKLETQQRVLSRSTYCVSTEVIKFKDEVGYIMKFNSAYLISQKYINIKKNSNIFPPISVNQVLGMVENNQ